MLCSPSCDQVATSASSSSVPRPPGRAMKASDRSYMSCLRSCIDATSCSSVRPAVASFTGEQACWDYPDDPAAVAEGGIGQLTHEAYAATAVDEIDAPARYNSSQGTGRIPVLGISRQRRPAEHANSTESHHTRNLPARRRRLPRRPAGLALPNCADHDGVMSGRFVIARGNATWPTALSGQRRWWSA